MSIVERSALIHVRPGVAASLLRLTATIWMPAASSRLMRNGPTNVLAPISRIGAPVDIDVTGLAPRRLHVARCSNLAFRRHLAEGSRALRYEHLHQIGAERRCDDEPCQPGNPIG